MLLLSGGGGGGSSVLLIFRSKFFFCSGIGLCLWYGYMRINNISSRAHQADYQARPGMSTEDGEEKQKF